MANLNVLRLAGADSNSKGGIKNLRIGEVPDHTVFR